MVKHTCGQLLEQFFFERTKLQDKSTKRRCFVSYKVGTTEFYLKLYPVAWQKLTHHAHLAIDN